MRDNPNAVMLFAAGFGTRMGALTNDRPKPLVNVAGRALLDHALDQVDGIKPDRIVVNCHYFPDQVKTHLKDRADITLIHEDREILETGADLRTHCQRWGVGPFLQ